MLDPPANSTDNDTLNHNTPASYPVLKFHWCCTEPIFSGGGGISIGTPNRDVDQVRAAPLPRGQGWEDLEYSAQEWSKTFPKYAYGDPRKPDYTLETGHIAMMKWLLGPPDREPTACPRNLCQECYDTPQWKVHCKSCSKPLCIEHDLRGLRLRICGYRDLTLEKMAIQNRPGSSSQQTTNTFVPSHVPYMSSSAEFELPYRTHRALDSTASSITEDNPADGIPDTGSHALPSLREQDGTCRRLEEEKAAREQKWKQDMQMLEGILETKIANEVAEFAGQFFNTVEPGSSIEQVEDAPQDAQPSHHVRIFDGSPWMGPVAEENLTESLE
ncbi:hypothetical protein BBP40_002812 [Aspergillus hancockii]|nr:hypothetical protein BBP40_002812 [Aspergillus hancockii]